MGKWQPIHTHRTSDVSNKSLKYSQSVSCLTVEPPRKRITWNFPRRNNPYMSEGLSTPIHNKIEMQIEEIIDGGTVLLIDKSVTKRSSTQIRGTQILQRWDTTTQTYIEPLTKVKVRNWTSLTRTHSRWVVYVCRKVFGTQLTLEVSL